MGETARRYSQLTPQAFEDVLAVGSRLETWDGIWGTVTEIRNVTTHGHILAKLVTFHAEHTPSFGPDGWPHDGGPMDITREIRKHSSDLRLVSTTEGI